MNRIDLRNFFPVFPVFIISCSPLNRVSNRDIAVNYDPSKDVLFPQYIVYNVTDTSTRLYLKISSDHILYRQSDDGRFLSNIRLYCRIFESFETDRFSDNCSFVLEDVQTDDEPHVLIKYVDFKTPLVKTYVLELTLTDFIRQHTQKLYLPVNNKSIQSPVNYLIVKASDSIPLFTPYLSSETEFSILCRKRINKNLFVRYFNRQFPLAAPAFKINRIEKFNYCSDQTYQINLEHNNSYRFKDQGIYHLQTDSSILSGLTICRFSDDYPRQTQANELVEPLRYLTTSREFNRIVTTNDKKAAID